MSLPQMLAAKLKELELSPTAAAEKAGVAYPSFAAVVAGKSLPNARTFKKYGKFLGVGADQIEKLVLEAKGSKPAGKRRGRPPGRKPGRRGAGGLVSSLKDAVKLAGEAEAVLADDLAMRVHALPKAKRAVVEAVIGAR